MPDDAAPRTIRDESVLRDIVGEPLPWLREKEMPKLDKHCRHFISLSPIAFIGSTGADGKGDVTPRGDPPGFIRVLDDKTIAIPERPGNKRADTLRNILANPNVGVIFLVPGINEVLRINGRASVVEDPALLATMEVQGKTPKLAIRIDIDDVFFHCAKALTRAKLWDPASKVERKSFPTMGQIQHDQKRSDVPVAEIDASYNASVKNTLY